MTAAASLPPLLIMGVADCGKSALGELLAESTGCGFFDGWLGAVPAEHGR